MSKLQQNGCFLSIWFTKHNQAHRKPVDRARKWMNGHETVNLSEAGQIR